MIHRLLLSFYLLFSYTLVFSQVVIEDQNFGILVQLNEKSNWSDIQNKLSNYHLKVTKLSEAFDIYKIETENSISEAELFDRLKTDRRIKHISYDALVSQRIKPNDSRINEQYSLQVIKAYEAWDVTTGGKNALGEDIVIAVVDDGFDIQHEDLSANIWVNKNEISGDNKDNDGNGFIDDINGWNVRTNSGAPDNKSHGTYIFGALGAVGNNNIGISGVNWNVKVMTVSTGSMVSDVIEGYDYIYNMRKLYNTSGGTKGANIVVSSYSGGLSNAFANDYPIWCNLYDKLGFEGVLSVTATTNEKDNVDVVGDMPSTCTSNYLIVVTSSNKLDELDEVTGYGPTSVDLSAPGDNVLTTDVTSKGKYKTESGTSLATPIVAGGVALLYAFPCIGFTNAYKADPSDVALKVKEAILTSVDEKNSMKGLIQTGGRLNVYNAFIKLKEEYNNCDVIIEKPTETRIVNVKQDGSSSVYFTYELPNPGSVTYSIVDAAGKLLTRATIDGLIKGSVSIGDLVMKPGVYYILLDSDDGKDSSAFYYFDK